MTLDGEGVACGPDGVSDFERMRAAVAREGSRDAFLYAFDLLEINGDDLRRYEWQVRRATLASLLRGAGHGIQFSGHIDSADGEAVFQHACAMGLEGIVSIRSITTLGARNRRWLQSEPWERRISGLVHRLLGGCCGKYDV